MNNLEATASLDQGGLVLGSRTEVEHDPKPLTASSPLKHRAQAVLHPGSRVKGVALQRVVVWTQGKNNNARKHASPLAESPRRRSTSHQTR